MGAEDLTQQQVDIARQVDHLTADPRTCAWFTTQVERCFALWQAFLRDQNEGNNSTHRRVTSSGQNGLSRDADSDDRGESYSQPGNDVPVEFPTETRADLNQGPQDPLFAEGRDFTNRPRSDQVAIAATLLFALREYVFEASPRFPLIIVHGRFRTVATVASSLLHERQLTSMMHLVESDLRTAGLLRPKAVRRPDCDRLVRVAEAAAVINERSDHVHAKLRTARKERYGPKGSYMAELDDIVMAYPKMKKRLHEWADKHYPRVD